MSFIESGKALVLEMLRERATLKQELCARTGEIFHQLNDILRQIEEEYTAELGKLEKPPRFLVKDHGEFEKELVFGGDILYFTMHSNIFNFEQTHAVHQTDYVRQDPSRAYCGMIQVHNFLFDSIKYQRNMDIGYLIGRIFINKEGHFFVEGKRQLGFLYNDFGSAELNETYIRSIVESAMIYTIDFDLLVPPYDQVQMISVQQKIHQQNNQAFQTGKRVGFKFQYEQQEIEGKKKD